MKNTHSHHIIPKHIGGLDNPDNLIELTIEEHAIAHKLLWLEYNKLEDYIAWKGLSGLVGKEELLLEVNKLKARSWNVGLTAARQAHYSSAELQNHGKWLAQTHGKANLTKEHQCKAAKASVEKKRNTGWISPLKNKTYSELEKEKLYPLSTCPSCGKVGNARGIKQWHGENGEKCKQR
jgi:hypothetical protein